ncbi:MAG TPA: DUF3465 domain-containing protein, partial [Woeseiaceae bacterium]|nr:DUF3465 domain-containing protein [Woeseiaceae bacterium]
MPRSRSIRDNLPGRFPSQRRSFSSVDVSCSPAKNNKRAIELNPVYDRRHTGTWIEGSGIVRRMVPDDNDGSRHQRFVLDTRNGQTLLIAHNIDLAERIPVGVGDRIRFRGMYEWNEFGGLVHWTHHDP